MFEKKEYFSQHFSTSVFFKMATEEEKSESLCIYEARNEEMISPEGGKSTVRPAKFLKPFSRSIEETSGVPNTSTSQISSEEGHESDPKLILKGWKKAPKKWGEWIENLIGKYALKWNQASLDDPILSSLYQINCNPNMILVLVEYWCPETNTFVFPWGEATVTLEDVMMIGGFSVLGEPVNLTLSDDLQKMDSEMKQLGKYISKGKSREGDLNGWIRFLMEEGESHELEHVGFLSVWLSRFVFTSFPDSSINNHVVPIAMHLSQGKRISLAPAVLTNIYQNLTMLKEKLISSSLIKKSPRVCLSGSFQVVQLWIFERFPILGPKCPIELKPGEPRIARWHKLKSNASLSLARKVLKSGEGFQWKPFSVGLRNWCFVTPYKDNEQFVADFSSSEEELKAFGLCLCADEIVGLNFSTEKYMPNRVAMQFGFDQDSPSKFTVVKPNNGNQNFSFCVPAKGYKPCVSLRYFNWWKKKQIEEKDILKEGKRPNEPNMPYPTDKSDFPENERKKKSEESDLRTDMSDFDEPNCDEINNFKGLVNGERDEQHDVGTSSNPLDVEGYVQGLQAVLESSLKRRRIGTCAHPIDVDECIQYID